MRVVRYVEPEQPQRDERGEVLVYGNAFKARTVVRSSRELDGRKWNDAWYHVHQIGIGQYIVDGHALRNTGRSPAGEITRETQINARFTRAERDAIRARAESKGVSAGTWLRDTALQALSGGEKLGEVN